MIIFIWRFLFPLKNITNCKILIILDRKSTRLNSSHVRISYAVFCLKKKKPLIKIAKVILVMNMFLYLRFLCFLSVGTGVSSFILHKNRNLNSYLYILRNLT